MKGSKYSLSMSLMYLRLAYQSMSKDQMEAAAVIAARNAESEDHLETVEERLQALAAIVLEKVKTLELTE
jgi:hypothetical protein